MNTYCSIENLTVTSFPQGAKASVAVKNHGNASEIAVSAACENGFAADCAVKIAFPNADAKWMAIEHYTPFWCHPVFGKGLSGIPAETQFLLWQENTTYRVLFPLCGKEYATSLQGEDGKIALKIFSLCEGMKECVTPAAVFAEGEEPYAVMDAAAKLASKLTGAPLRGDRCYPEVFEYLGWCSWDSMEIWVNEDGVMDKCREFADKQVPIKWGILDDMWADVAWTKKLPPFTDHSISFDVMHESKLKDYTADPERFPNGLDGCIAKMKEFGLKVGVWHPVTGYWLGLEPGSEAEKKLKDFTVTRENGWILPDLRDLEKAKGFFGTIHEYLKDCGTDFIKIDNQSCLRDRFSGLAPLGVLADNLQKAIDCSADERFAGQLINCMGQANENIFHRTSAISRCSDDFQPENRPWFAKHLTSCAYNGLWQGQFQVNDWDMWWTDDTQALRNSVLRAISGGPIYVSDRIGRTNKELLDPLCFADGRICRCDGVAIPARENLLDAPTKSDKAFCVHNTCRTATLIGAFNINDEERPVSGSICPKDYGFTGKTLVYDRFNKTARELNPEDEITFTLQDAEDFRLYILLPILGKRTVIGLSEKINCVAAILSETDTEVTLYEGGTLAWYDGTLHFDVAEKVFKF